MVKEVPEWRDALGRYGGKLVVDQESNNVYCIGGFDRDNNDSLDYISCFLNCRWENGEFKYIVDKSHHLFSNKKSKEISNFSTFMKISAQANKITLRNASYLIFNYDRSPQDKKYK